MKEVSMSVDFSIILLYNSMFGLYNLNNCCDNAFWDMNNPNRIVKKIFIFFIALCFYVSAVYKTNLMPK